MFTKMKYKRFKNKKNILVFSSLVVTVAGLALVLTNIQLGSFDIRSLAKPPSTEAECTGCSSKYRWTWDKKAGECKKRYDASCGSRQNSFTETCPGTCEQGIESCLEVNKANISGSCAKKGAICCGSATGVRGGGEGGEGGAEVVYCPNPTTCRPVDSGGGSWVYEFVDPPYTGYCRQTKNWAGDDVANEDLFNCCLEGQVTCWIEKEFSEGSYKCVAPNMRDTSGNCK
ncbi:MAG: hypothetical protein UY13_C0001G0024 [Candidatus Pacebacteria bacterium GW2011_GWB1_47_8]|nr:MAG: hypothetical protein UY13_C0001G0024 [Candidatus Pacebacteria bacterium GW2011_GWB1_47_8]